MLAYLITGGTFGLWAGLSPGPLQVVVIRQTLRYGACEGTKVAVAPILTDLPIIAVLLTLVTHLPDKQLFLGTVSLVGGGLVAWLALSALRQGPVELNLDEPAPRSLLKGALVNASSPHPYIFWLTIGVPTMVKANQIAAAVVFAASFFTLIIVAKMSLALLVSRSRDFLQGAAYIWSMRLTGVALLAFAGVLIAHGVIYLVSA